MREIFSNMAQGSGGLSQTNSKRKLYQLAIEIFQIDSKIQTFEGNRQHIPNFKAAKVELQTEILQTEIQLEYSKAQGMNRRR